MQLKGKSKGEGKQKASPVTPRMARAGAKRIAPKVSRFVLFLGDDGAILIFIQDGKVARRMYAPSAEKEHLQPFVELMEANPKAALYVLVDVIDQSYVRHTLPPVSPLGVNKLVNRRLERDFAPEDIKGSLSLGREKQGRKEWSFLLISLANNASLQQWLDAFLELPNQFMGIFLVPVEAQAFLEDLSAAVTGDTSENRAVWKILVTHDKVSGVRQVVLKDGQLIFTRLTQSTAEVSADLAAGNVEQEVLNTIEYLRRLSYSEQAGLEIYVLIAQEIKERMDVSKFRATRVNLFTPFEVAQLLNLGQAALSSDRYGDVVLGSSFGLNRKPKLKLTSAYGRKLDTLYKAKLGARIAAALVVAITGLMIVGDAISIGSISGAISDLEKQKTSLSGELATAKNDMASLGDDQAAIINTAELYKIAAIERVDPLAVVRALDPLMEPGTLVRSFSWKLTDAGALNPAVPAAPADSTTAPYELQLEVEFNAHGGSRDKLAADAKAFVGRLETAFSNYDVKADKLPGTMGDNGQVTMNFDDPSVKDKTLKEGENIVKLSISGPKPPAAATGAPPAGGGIL